MGDKVKGTIVMTGPVYDGVESSNKYSHVPDRVEGGNMVSGPVYPVDHQHKFSIFEPRVDVPTPTAGPIMNTIHSHHFREIVTNALALGDIFGGKHDYDMVQHNFSYEPPVVHETKTLLGPVYDILNEHHFNQIQTVAQELQTLQAPVYTEGAR